MVSPIVRSFYYFPMICDVFKLNYKDLSFNLRGAQMGISLGDRIFLNYKNMHISKALNTINKDLLKFTDENKAAKIQKGTNEETL